MQKEAPAPCLKITVKLALTSPTSGGRSIGEVRSWAQATIFFVFCEIFPGWTEKMASRNRWFPDRKF
jgi:hypothetical protein